MSLQGVPVLYSIAAFRHVPRVGARHGYSLLQEVQYVGSARPPSAADLVPLEDALRNSLGVPGLEDLDRGQPRATLHHSMATSASQRGAWGACLARDLPWRHTAWRVTADSPSGPTGAGSRSALPAHQPPGCFSRSSPPRSPSSAAVRDLYHSSEHRAADLGRRGLHEPRRIAAPRRSGVRRPEIPRAEPCSVLCRGGPAMSEGLARWRRTGGGRPAAPLVAHAPREVARPATWAAHICQADPRESRAGGRQSIVPQALPRRPM
eukprot:scaffold1517_cov397-Prasinococcus_capsulatus_cf.AAC.6